MFFDLPLSSRLYLGELSSTSEVSPINAALPLPTFEIAM